ncbi:MAG: rod shape-determining protein RodA [Pusillimonas sp.]|jgi:rod shape determining protein RodA|nr:rod shape-determining protein RodA [Pusillimonas sp.]MBC41684.1 rod shape-determining protein RodA [Pusillimonas sp.]|tara:strand:- start:66629 stop:67774 length:1146 start_codon:yes stop_codon:yes gene_type:complete
MKQYFRWVAKVLTVFDWPLLALLLLMTGLGLVIMHSAVGGTDWRFASQVRNYCLAFIALWVVAVVPPRYWLKLSPALYVVGVVLLVAVEFFGETSKGATRWLDLGIMRIQPSEMLKLTVPMMLAWYFQQYGMNRMRLLNFFAAFILLIIPFALIVRQPDLGTALLVLLSGFFVIYFAGLSFKLILPLSVVAIVGLGTMVYLETDICQPDVDWVVMHEYQKNRVCTLLNPSSDPLGKGFHTIQSMIAIGSGGVYGKGYMEGTQAHLDFVPERTTDFIFAVYAEEFGLYGGIMLLVLFALLIIRGLFISACATTQFGRLLAGALSMTFFVYVFVNIGMVTGILPVVGVPLPFMSYGGTALLTLGIACGLLMSINHYRQSSQVR